VLAAAQASVLWAAVESMAALAAAAAAAAEHAPAAAAVALSMTDVSEAAAST
jgi:hypothetical protein